jgi:ribonuclease P protein component
VNSLKSLKFSYLRLKNSKSFSFVIKKGRRFVSPNFFVYLLDLSYLNNYNGDMKFKLAITVSRRCGSAVKRNRIKRLIREFFRLNQRRINNNLWFVIRIKDNCNVIKYRDISDEFEKLFVKANIFRAD